MELQFDGGAMYGSGGRRWEGGTPPPPMWVFPGHHFQIYLLKGADGFTKLKSEI